MQDPLSLLVRTDTRKIFDLIEVRKTLEAWSAFNAAKRVTEDDIKQMESNIKEMRDAYEKGRSWEKEDADFHLAIAQATHNTIQTHIMSTIYDLLRESVAKVFIDRSKVKKLLHQHYRIFSAIKNHSPVPRRRGIASLNISTMSNQK
jgi:GntR family transcriptional repressor for pyruvate dehydrogenase complex